MHYQLGHNILLISKFNYNTKYAIIGSLIWPILSFYYLFKK